MQSAKTRSGADCISDHKLFIAKFRLKLKKVGKTTRPFRYDLNQISCDYTVELTNRFKGLNLIECLMNYGRRWVTLYQRQGSSFQSWSSDLLLPAMHPRAHLLDGCCFSDTFVKKEVDWAGRQPQELDWEVWVG